MDNELLRWIGAVAIGGVFTWVITDVVNALKAIREEVRLIRTMLERK